MYAMHEALARERMRELEKQSRHRQLVKELTAAGRWHRVRLRAYAAEERHAVRARQAAVGSAVAETKWA